MDGLLILLLSAAGSGGGFATGFETIAEKDLERDVGALASPALEGRDTPSLGLELAARLIEKRFEAAGLAYAPDAAGSFRRPFERTLPEPDAGACALSLEDGAGTAFALGKDFVPLAGHSGTAAGDLVFAGYGIRSKSEKYDDLAGLGLEGKIALVLEREPEHDRKFDGPELSRAASLWEKIDALAEAGAAGVLVVRRAQGVPQDEGLSFRYTWADFNGVPSDPRAKRSLPALEVSIECAGKLLGQDVDALGDRIDRSVRPVKAPTPGRRVRMQSGTKETRVKADNLVGLVRGSDRTLGEEYVVLGAHYDHVGVDARGRIACGADDNASGVAAILEVAEALASAGPRRSVLVCTFAGEEDGLLGSRDFCARPPVPKERLVAMINLDMIGRGDAGELAVLGIVQNPALEKVIARARKLRPSGLKQVVMRQGEELFQRSDHYSFHQIGVPSLFFFEGLPIERNKDYHTWRDTVDKISTGKMLNTTRFVYNATWILADDDERPPPPQD